MKSRVADPKGGTAAPRTGLPAVLLAIGVSSVSAAPADTLARRHDEGLQQFRAARFSAAFGRFVELAEVGHKPSAVYALWMCQHGLELFGKDWDCTGEQLQDWSQLAGVPTPALQPRNYGRTVIGLDRHVYAAKIARQLPRRGDSVSSRSDPARR